MIIVRNSTIQFRLGSLPCILIPYIIKKLEKKLLKTGKEHLSNWKEIWDLSISPLQRTVRLWLRKRAFKKFWGGVKRFKRVFQGQVMRLKLRKEIENVQLFFDTNPSLDARIDFEKKYNFLYFHGINFRETMKISCGITSANSSIPMTDNYNDDSLDNSSKSIDFPASITYSPDKLEISDSPSSTGSVTALLPPTDSLIEPKGRGFRCLPPIHHPEEKSLLSPVKIDYKNVPMTKSAKLRLDKKKNKNSTKALVSLTPLKVLRAHGKYAKTGVSWFQNPKQQKSPKATIAGTTNNQLSQTTIPPL